ncbi:MAG: nucleoside monophosphate kinase [Nostocaceae cyanobacterium]|nr:nucleoside monophosphate kinase [Nostocaceae cyanobacterium]
MRLVILGGSGAGKSTQAQRLCTHFDIPLISTSELLRQAIANQTDLGHQAQPYLGKGELVPDETMIQFIETYLKQTDFTNWVLEGYPRTAFQAEELDFLLEKLEQNLDWAIYLQVPEAVMVNRSLGRSLPDDHPEVVQRRVELFYDRTIPILEYYDRSRRLLTINGDQSPIQVQQTIVDLLPVA